MATQVQFHFRSAKIFSRAFTVPARRRCLFPFRKQAMPFLTVDAIIGNQACHNQ